MITEIKNKGNNIYYAVDDKHSLDACNILYEGTINPNHHIKFVVDNVHVELLVEIYGDLKKHFKMVVLKVDDKFFVYDMEKLFKGKRIANRITLLNKTVKIIENEYGVKIAQEIQNKAYSFAKYFSKDIMSGRLLLA